MEDHWKDNMRCPICDNLISSKKSNFKKHLMIHTDMRPFVCSICFKSFRDMCGYCSIALETLAIL